MAVVVSSNLWAHSSAREIRAHRTLFSTRRKCAVLGATSEIRFSRSATRDALLPSASGSIAVTPVRHRRISGSTLFGPFRCAEIVAPAAGIAPANSADEIASSPRRILAGSLTPAIICGAGAPSKSAARMIAWPMRLEPRTEQLDPPTASGHHSPRIDRQQPARRRRRADKGRTDMKALRTGASRHQRT